MRIEPSCRKLPLRRLCRSRKRLLKYSASSQWMPYGWSSIQRTAATTSGRSSKLTSHNQERSLKRVCFPQGLSSFSTEVGKTEMSVSSDATASLSMNGHRTQLGWDQRIFFYRGTPPECAKKVPINS